MAHVSGIEGSNIYGGSRTMAAGEISRIKMTGMGFEGGDRREDESQDAVRAGYERVTKPVHMRSIGDEEARRK